MIQKPADEARNIKRHELMDHTAREALCGEAAGRDRASRHDHADTAGAYAIDQRQHTGQFAYAGAVQPHQRAIRPVEAGFPSALE